MEGFEYYWSDVGSDGEDDFQPTKKKKQKSTLKKPVQSLHQVALEFLPFSEQLEKLSKGVIPKNTQKSLGS